ncbi:hypothetical protein [Dehalogenimonas etheniformans]|uniref:Uncharacterized protein n=1 Tax=Dehalogenimonas etheniformans TaxID=1536648 RepID=A0A2P5P7W0_9CHLR|nr:hypothetical protein [Dehalogenimonas etheniformans]PPD58393.1 hypothetical protein JP09_004620 [Dehalogenimonas etheniformans]QNT76968.1 hypothetical protein HX448_09925 [Dehalogenimonas etheniformans]
MDVFKLAKGLKAKEEANANKSGETQSPPKQIAASTREVAMSEILKNAGRHFVDINGHYEVVVDGDMVTINTIHDESGRVVAKAMFDGSEWGRIVAWVEWAKHDWNTQSEGRS